MQRAQTLRTELASPALTLPAFTFLPRTKPCITLCNLYPNLMKSWYPHFPLCEENRK